MRSTKALWMPCLPLCVPSTTRSEEHTSELQSRGHLVCRLLLEKKNKKSKAKHHLILAPAARCPPFFSSSLPSPPPRALHSFPTRRSSDLKLNGRSMMFIRNVGHLMTNPAILDKDGNEVYEGIMDAVFTSLCAKHDKIGRAHV